jgi:hypothetical protein
MNTATVTIISDAAPGPNADPDATTVVTLSGIGLALTITTPEDFGEILLCETSISRTITIANPGTQDEHFRITASGDVANFSITVSDTIIRAGGTASITIQYIPDPGRRTITLEISSPALQQPYRITLTAIGVTRTLELTVNDATIDIGQTKPITIRFATPPDAGSLVHQIRLQLAYETTALEIANDKFQPLQNGWSWSLQNQTNGAILDGTSALGITSGSLELQVPFTTFISSMLSHPITPTLLNADSYPCLIVQSTSGKVTTPYYCAQQTRQVVLVEQTTFSIHQQGSDLVVRLMVGEDIPYQLDIYSITGAHVTHLATGNRRGDFTYTIGSDILPSGAYFVQLMTPLRTLAQPVFISR